MPADCPMQTTSVVRGAGRTEAIAVKIWGAGRGATGRAPHESGRPKVIIILILQHIQNN